MRYPKKQLVTVAKKISAHHPITPHEIHLLLNFEKSDENSKVTRSIKQIALPLSLLLGFLIGAFPDNTTAIINHLPAWTNLPGPVSQGIDYL